MNSKSSVIMPRLPRFDDMDHVVTLKSEVGYRSKFSVDDGSGAVWIHWVVRGTFVTVTSVELVCPDIDADIKGEMVPYNLDVCYCLRGGYITFARSKHVAYARVDHAPSPVRVTLADDSA